MLREPIVMLKNPLDPQPLLCKVYGYLTYFLLSCNVVSKLGSRKLNSIALLGKGLV